MKALTIRTREKDSDVFYLTVLYVFFNLTGVYRKKQKMYRHKTPFYLFKNTDCLIQDRSTIYIQDFKDIENINGIFSICFKNEIKLC